MKAKRYMLFVVLGLFLTMSFSTGCKKSSSENNNPTGPVTGNTSIVGTWMLTKISVPGANNTKTDYTPQQAGVMIVWTFRSDNTGQVDVTDSAGTTTNKGTYTFSNNTISLKDTSGQTLKIPIAFTSNNSFTMQTNIDVEGTPTTATLEFTRQASKRWDFY
jgi:hypothetical protein